MEASENLQAVFINQDTLETHTVPFPRGLASLHQVEIFYLSKNLQVAEFFFEDSSGKETRRIPILTMQEFQASREFRTAQGVLIGVQCIKLEIKPSWKQWTCSVCTFFNDGATKQCGICGNYRNELFRISK